MPYSQIYVIKDNVCVWNDLLIIVLCKSFNKIIYVFCIRVLFHI